MESTNRFKNRFNMKNQKFFSQQIFLCMEGYPFNSKMEFMKLIVLLIAKVVLILILMTLFVFKWKCVVNATPEDHFGCPTKQ